MDYTQLHRAYSQRGKKPKASPVTMFKVIVYGMSEGVYSKRQRARKCKRDANYIWLLNDEPAPTHDALTWFCSHQLAEAAEGLFYQLLKTLHASGEICYEHLFVDGTKLEANANRYNFVWKKSTTKYESRIDEKLAILLPELCAGYGLPGDTPEAMLAALGTQMTGPIVHGRGKWFEKQSRVCYIKPQNYERNKTRKFKSNMHLRENMPYDVEKDEYTCPGGKKLRAVYEGKRKSKSGFESEITYYECESCAGCPLKKGCTRAKGNRKMGLSKQFLCQREESRLRITSEQGILLRMNRSIQAESVLVSSNRTWAFGGF